MRSLAAIVFALAACGQVEAPVSEHAEALRVENAWAAPTPSGVDVSAGYLTVVNGASTADALVAVSTPRAQRVEIHEMRMDGSVMHMRAVSRLDITAGRSVSLAPGGRHLMFIGVTQPFVEGETIPVRLSFERAGEIDVSLPVRSAGATHTGGH